MRWTVLMCLSGCSFSAAQQAPPDGPDLDSPIPVLDARPAQPDGPTACAVMTSHPGIDRGRVGGNGGSTNNGPLECELSDQVVGIALRMSAQDTVFNGPSAYAIQIACAHVTVDVAGTGSTGTVYTREVTGTGEYMWTPAMLTPITQCQPGWVVSGLQAHTGPNVNRFFDVSMRCSKLGPSGAATTTEVKRVVGSLTESQGPSTVNCNAGEVIAVLPNKSGAGIDSLNLFCSPPMCQ